jgi:hypothetical protein
MFDEDGTAPQTTFSFEKLKFQFGIHLTIGKRDVAARAGITAKNA